MQGRFAPAAGSNGRLAQPLQQSGQAQILNAGKHLHLHRQSRQDMLFLHESHFASDAAKLGVIAAPPHRVQNVINLIRGQDTQIDEDLAESLRS